IAVFANEAPTGPLLLCAAILAVPLVWRTQASLELLAEPTAEHTPGRLWITVGLMCLPLGGLLYALLAPHDVATAAGQCYAESHVGSSLVGPALYYRSPEAVPGLDFESHYGIGHAYAFSLVTGSHGFEKTMERYVLFVLVVSVAYFLSAFLVLTDWLRSPW